jgi:hypothetical protein
MEIQINNNLDQWCFDYLENQLSTSHKKAFELELKNNKKAVACLEKWKSSTVASINYIDFDQELLIRISKESKKSPLRIIIPVFVAIVAVGIIFYFNYSKSDIEEIEESITSEIKEDKKDTIIDRPLSSEKRVREIIPNGVPSQTGKLDSNKTATDSISKKGAIIPTPTIKKATKIVPPKKSVPKPIIEPEEVIEITPPTIQIPSIVAPPTSIETPTPLQTPEPNKELTKKEKRKAEKN